MSDSVRPYELQPARLLCPWDSPNKNTEWVAMTSSRGSSPLRDQIYISYLSCVCRRFLHHHSHLGSPLVALISNWGGCPLTMPRFTWSFPSHQVTFWCGPQAELLRVWVGIFPDLFAPELTPLLALSPWPWRYSFTLLVITVSSTSCIFLSRIWEIVVSKWSHAIVF